MLNFKPDKSASSDSMQLTNEQSSASWWLDIILLTLALGCLQFLMLGDRPLFVPDEGRYAEIAREMATSGDYITPYLNHVKYFEKPALFYWLGAIAIKAGGANLWAIRSVNAILAIFGCLMTYIATRCLFDRATAIIASAILATSTLYFVMAHMVSLDLPVTVFLSATFYSFLLGINQPPESRSRRNLLWAASITAGLAVLTKGLIGLVFPGLIILSWIALLNQWQLLRQMYLPSCIIIFLAVTLPWHLLVGSYNPEFFYFYFVEQHFLRYINPDIGHYQPVWFFSVVIVAAFFPWIVFMLQGYANGLPLKWQNRHQKKTSLFLVIWATVIFAFFSLSKSKLIPYILPVIPPLSILTAIFLRKTLDEQTRWLRRGYGLLLISSLAIAYVFYQFSHHTVLPDPARARYWLGIASSILVIGSILAFIYSYFNNKYALIVTTIMSYLFLLSFLAAAPALDTRSILPLAETLKPMLTPQDEVITYNQYYQDLPFYLERRVSILNWENELSYGMQHQDTSAWMIDNKAFWRKWNSKSTIFVLMDKEEYHLFKERHPDSKPYVIDRTINNVLITNRPRNNPT